jgi:hypothetical protein
VLFDIFFQKVMWHWEPDLYAGLDPDPATGMHADQCGCVSERVRIRNLTGMKGNQLTAEIKRFTVKSKM